MLPRLCAHSHPFCHPPTAAGEAFEYDVEADVKRHADIAAALKPFVTDTVELVNDMHDQVSRRG